MKADVSMSRVRLWDWPVRAIHWAIVVLLLFSWWSNEDHMDWHRRSGYAIAALLAFRLVWGFAGGETARFSNFVKGPRTVLAYVRGQAPAGLGHNPLGAISVVALLAVLTLHLCIGFFSIDEEGFEAGPLAQFISFDLARAFAAAHEWSFRALLALAVLHVAAIGWYFYKGQNLITPMITGWKRVPLAMPQPAPGQPWALAAGAVVAIAVFATLMWLNHRAGFG